MVTVDEKEILDRLSQDSGQNLELAEGFPNTKEERRGLAKKMTAFANTNDGTILVGIDGRTKRIIGVGQVRNFTDEIAAIDKEYCDPSVMPEASVVRTGMKMVGVIQVSRGNSRPYCVEGDCYVRSDRKVYIASHNELQGMYGDGGDFKFKDEKGDGWPLEGTSYGDLDAKKVDEYLAKRREKLGGGPADKEKKVLRDLSILIEQDGRMTPSAGAIMMFGKQPQRFIPHSSVKIAKFKGKDIGSVILDQAEMRGTVPEMIDGIAQFLLKYMSSGSTIAGLKRDDYTEYPIVAVRELITNAIVHRDYSIYGAHVRIFMFDDRVEIYTPGGLPASITVTNIEYTQYSRNRVITEILIYTGQYIEKLGTGIRRVKKAIKERGLKEPKFFDTGADFVVILFGPLGKTLQVRERERVDRIQQVLGPSKTPQEIGRLPDHKKLHVKRQTGEAHLSRGKQRVARKKTKVKRSQVIQAATITTAVIVIGFALWADARRNNPALHYKRAAQLHRRGDYSRAAQAYADFVKRFPVDIKAGNGQYYMAACLEMMGEYTEALNAYQVLLKDYPESEWASYAQYWRGTIYFKLGQLDKATEEFDAVMKKYPGELVTLSALRDMALCLQQQARFADAIDAYQRILTLTDHVSDGYEHYQMGLCYLELDQSDKAKENFDKVVANKDAKPELIKKAKQKIKELNL